MSSFNSGINHPSAGRERKFHAPSKWNWQQSMSSSISVKPVILEMSLNTALELLCRTIKLSPYSFPVFEIPLHKPVSEKKDTCKVLGEEQVSGSLMFVPNFKETICFLRLKYVFERTGMQTDGRIEANKWPIGFQEENMFLGNPKKN